MADPRTAAVQDRKSPLSPLMRALTGNHKGEKINFCPFGCEDGDLDDNGYCRHLIGFTNDGKLYEPMVRRKGQRVVQVEREMSEAGLDEEGNMQYTQGPPRLLPVVKGDKLERITTSSRVYRDVDKAK